MIQKTEPRLPASLREGLRLRFCDLRVSEAATVPISYLGGNSRTGTVRGRKPFGPSAVLRFFVADHFLTAPEIRAEVVAVLYSEAPSDFDNLVTTVEALEAKGVSCLLLAFTRPARMRLRETDLPWVSGKRFWIGDLIAGWRFLALAREWDSALDGRVVSQSDGTWRWPFLLYHIVSCFGMERFLRELLVQAEAKVLLTGTDIQPETKLAVAVARDLGIPSITLQHGILPPSPGDALHIPAWSDHVAVWGQRSRAWFMEAGIQADRIAVTGCPRFDTYAHLRGEDKAPPDPEDAQVTLLLNPSSPSLRAAMLHEFAGAVQDTTWRLVLRLHPAEDMEQLRGVWRAIAPQDTRARATLSQQEPLVGILQASDVVVTYDSTAGLEAMLLGKPVVVYGSHLFPTPSRYPTWDDAPLLTRPETLKERLQDLLLDPALRSKVVAIQDRFVVKESRNADGGATQRLTSFVIRIASSGGQVPKIP